LKNSFPAFLAKLLEKSTKDARSDTYPPRPQSLSQRDRTQHERKFDLRG
jgi:hypothetical protein